MPDLSIQFHDSPDIPQGAVAVLNGAIDAKTVVNFQGQLNQAKDRGVSRFILDMEHVKYINSTGLGYLINLADSVQPLGGGVALVKVQPKVKIVFDMLGLNAFFNIYGSRKEAVNFFASRSESPATEEEAPAEAMESEPAAQEDPAPETGEAPAEPGAVTCAGCLAQLTVSGPGAYKCPRCAALFTLRDGGAPSFQPREKLLQIQLSLTSAEECREGLGRFVELFARRAGFSSDLINCLREAVDDTVEQVVENAYGGDSNALCNVLLITTDSQIELRLADHGRSLRPETVNAKGQELFSLARQVMDAFDLRSHPRGGNVITMKKSSKMRG